MTLPPIEVDPAGRVLAGPYILQPSARTWRQRRCHWRVLSAQGRALTGWHLTPRLALLSLHLQIAAADR